MLRGQRPISRIDPLVQRSTRRTRNMQGDDIRSRTEALLGRQTNVDEAMGKGPRLWARQCLLLFD